MTGVDVTAELQHQIRELRHQVAGERAKFLNEKTLRERDRAALHEAREALRTICDVGDRAAVLVARDVLARAGEDSDPAGSESGRATGSGGAAE